MSASTEDQEPCSRDSRSQTGPPLSKETDGKSMLTQDKLGTTPCTNSTLSGLLCNSGERDKSLTLSSGLDSSNGVRELPQDSSTTRSPIQPGSDTMVISITQRRSFTLSLVEIKINKLFSVWTPPLRKVEPHSRLSGNNLANWPLRSSRWRICYTLTRWASGFPKSLTSREFGNSTEITPLSQRLLKPLTPAN